MKNAEWKTKDGKILKIKEMTDSHLINCIKLLRRWGQYCLCEEINAAYSCLTSFLGEMAQYYCEQEINRMESMTADEFLKIKIPQFDSLINEAIKRKLKI